MGMTAAQRQARLRNLSKAPSHSRENVCPLADAPNGSEAAKSRSSPRAADKLRTALDTARTENRSLCDRISALELQRDAHAQAKLRLQRSAAAEQSALVATHRSALASLESQLAAARGDIALLRRKLKAANARAEYTVRHRDAVCARAVAKATKSARIFHLKASGRYKDSVRDLFADLVCLGKVPTEHVSLVIQLVADCMHLTLLPTRLASARTVRRALGEAGIGSEIQVASTVSSPSGMFACDAFCGYWLISDSEIELLELRWNI